MKVDRFEFTKKFQKAYIKLPRSRQTHVDAALKLAARDLDDPKLGRHELKGSRTGITSLSAGGDLRILCRLDEDTGDLVALLLLVGTHSQLYG